MSDLNSNPLAIHYAKLATDLVEARDEIERLTNALAEEQEANSIAYMALERLTADLQHARNLLGNASGALADYTNLPTDTNPADAIRILADKVWEEQS